MKTIIKIEVTTADKIPVLMEDGDVWANYTKEQKEECRALQADYAERFHQNVVGAIKTNPATERFFEDVTEDEYSVEGFDSFKDYKTKIKVTVKKQDG